MGVTFLYIGLGFTILGAIFYQLCLSAKVYGQKKLNFVLVTIVALSFETILFISWIILADAFRRFRNLKLEGKLLHNMKVFALVFTYFLYASEVFVEISMMKIFTD